MIFYVEQDRKSEVDRNGPVYKIRMDDYGVQQGCGWLEEDYNNS